MLAFPSLLLVLRLLLLLFIITASGLKFADQEDQLHKDQLHKNGSKGNTNDDEITMPLPGLNFEPNFKHFSGFFQVSVTHFLHYWFVTSQGDPSKDPLVFWFNGGPGCSSIDGLLKEMGPYLVQPDGQTLAQNPHAWNRCASIVYVEAPAGVGYSYATDGNITTSDDLTSLESYEAIKQFFGRHPAFRNNSLFITGESYGGVYVPTVTARILDGMVDFPVNLKGIAIGNGLLNAKMNVDTAVRFAYSHGIIGERDWHNLERECCGGCIDGCDLSAQIGFCAEKVDELFEFLTYGGLNRYDLYRNCDPNPSRNSPRWEMLLWGLLPTRMLNSLNSNNSKSISQQMNQQNHGVHSPIVPCLNDTDLVVYMNLPEVRTSLHIPAVLGHWETCNVNIREDYQKQYEDTAPLFKRILTATRPRQQLRALLYYGDTDMACNFMLGQQFSAGLGLRRTLDGKRPWKFGDQVGGFKTTYAKGRLTFLTVRGAGHMAPQWRAPQMAYVFSQFLKNHPI